MDLPALIFGSVVRMKRRDVQRWVENRRTSLSAAGVRVDFGFGPTLASGDASSWASFTSAMGAGRLVLAPDGSTRVDAHAYLDGASTCRDRHEVGSYAQLDALAGLLTPAARTLPI